jgi:hypothetical protein
LFTGLSIILLIAVALTIAGLRGRIVGDDPHCAKCGFNLRGRSEESTRCSECGSEIDLPGGTRMGLRHRRISLLLSGLLLVIVSAGSIGVLTWRGTDAAAWAEWKPAFWLERELDSADPAIRTAAKNELVRRIQTPGASPATVNALVDAALARQADRKTKWNFDWGDLIGAAGKVKLLTADRYERYIKQAAAAKLTVKPRLRRGQSMMASVDLRFERIGSILATNGQYRTSPLKLGTAELLNSLVSSSATGGGTYMTSFTLDPAKVATLRDGEHEMTCTLHVSAAMTVPFKGPSVEWDLPLSAPVTLYPKDATVDEFRVEEKDRTAMRDAISQVRVFKAENGNLDVRIRSAQLPHPLACEVVLVQGPEQQRVGEVLLEPGKPGHWSLVYTTQKPKLVGKVTVELRPSQTAADREMALGTYWGETIVIRDVVIDAPYVVPFKHDKSLRAGVTKALTAIITRSGPSGRLGVDLNAKDPPVKLAYEVFIRADDREERVTDWTVSANTNMGCGTSCKDPDPSAKKVDVIFRPDRNWEIHSADSVEPWGGEVVLHDVPVQSTEP